MFFHTYIMKGTKKLKRSSIQDSDSELVNKAILGDKDAYGELVERYADMMYHIALSKIGDCDRAQDVVQDSFLTGYQNLARLRNPSSFGFWIAGITRNICSNHIREIKRTPLSLDAIKEEGIEPRDPGNQADHESDVRLLHEIRSIIDTLHPTYREIIDLRCTLEFSYQKIAEVLGISMSAVKNRLYHARRIILKIAKKKGLL